MSHTVVVVAGNRIPFAKAGGPYARASNHDLLTAALDGLIARTGLAGTRVGEVAGGAVLKHSNDFNLTREAVLSSALAPESPACDLQQACATGLETTMYIANKIALGQLESGIAAGVDSASDAPIAVSDPLRRILLEASRARSAKERIAAFARVRPRHLSPATPRVAEPRTGLSMGEHQAVTTVRWGIDRAAQDELAAASHHRLAAAWDRGFFDDLVTPYLGVTRDAVLRPDTSVERLATLPVAFGGPDGTMTAGNSTPLSDGAAAVLLANEEWARAHHLTPLARVVDAEIAAVDHPGGADLLLAPVAATGRLLARQGLTVDDIDLFEIHEAFASTVLATLKAWQDAEYCASLGLAGPIGEIDRDRLNVAGSSLAAGHPFAATGARIVPTLAKLLHERGPGTRGLISVCAAGGQGVVAILEAGLHEPPRLRRGRTFPQGPIVLAPLGASTLAADTLGLMGRSFEAPVIDSGDQAPGYGDRIGALVVDATDLRTVVELEALRAVLRPAVRGIERAGRIVVVARPATGADWEADAVARALDGINRTVGKELRGGATANLVYVDPAATPGDLVSTLAFLLHGRSAFVDGQSWRVRAADGGATRIEDAPLAGRVCVVTGAARGIGAAIARTLARDGATVVAVDMPTAGEALAAVANEVAGTALQLDITADDAGSTIAAHVAARGARIHAMIHNAGITRDKMLVNTDAARWAAVLDVNLAAEMRINAVLLDPATEGGMADHGRIVGVASTSGLAGNKGQTNYAASKAGVAGLVAAMAPDLIGRGITANAVAPGFIETEMTARIPFVQREIFRRANSLSQGGDPVDVAETIAYLVDPGSQGVTGQVIRVCGQNMVGA